MKVLGIGELLWDVFPTGRIWGGAPGNFCFYAQQAGAESLLVTAVGQDDAGKDLLSAAKTAGLNVYAAQVAYATGMVNISLNKRGEADFVFQNECAWDFIPFDKFVQEQISGADLLYFGTLAQRHPRSRQTILSCLEQRRPSARVFLDVNFRQKFYTPDIVDASLDCADYVKINEDEQTVLMNMTGLKCEQIVEKYALKLLLLTQGEKGSIVFSPETAAYLPAEKCEPLDTVGAGDSFAAVFIMHYLNGKSIEQAQKLASQAAAVVCQNRGALVELPPRFRV